MFTYKAFLFLLMLSVAKSEVDFKTMCRQNYTTLTNNPIDVLQYCSDHLCIEKCCGEGEVLLPWDTCKNTKTLFKKNLTKAAWLASKVNYSKVILFSWDGNTKKKSKKDFIFVNNHRDLKGCTAQHSITNDFFILENGSILMQHRGGSNSWFPIDWQEYCIELKLTKVNKKPEVILVVRETTVDPDYELKNPIFVIVGLLVSSFFLVLVLVVYSLLPKLQNLTGLVLMAYTVSILAPLLVELVIHLSNGPFKKKHCRIICPVMYFAAVSSIFWSNVMSVDVWWTLRGHRKRCDNNRRGERVKFMWYCLYAWGVPLLITAIVTTLDNSMNRSYLPFKEPPFGCFVDEITVGSYFYIPTRVLIFINTILFVLTVYNIWTIKRAVNKSQDSRGSEQQNIKFTTYAKLSLMMGLSWWLEFLPDATIWLCYILIELWRFLIVFATFYLFVCKKKVLVLLCKKFNIRKDSTTKMELVLSQQTKTGITRPTGVTSPNVDKSSEDQSQELDRMQNCPKEETTIF